MRCYNVKTFVRKLVMRMQVAADGFVVASATSGAAFIQSWLEKLRTLQGYEGPKNMNWRRERRAGMRRDRSEAGHKDTVNGTPQLKLPST